MRVVRKFFGRRVNKKYLVCESRTLENRLNCCELYSLDYIIIIIIIIIEYYLVSNPCGSGAART